MDNIGPLCTLSLVDPRTRADYKAVYSAEATRRKELGLSPRPLTSDGGPAYGGRPRCCFPRSLRHRAEGHRQNDLTGTDVFEKK